MPSIHRLAKRSLLGALRLCGAFPICERLSASGLTILCYHGIALRDEHRWKPKLFMRPEVFASRMDWLHRNGYRALALDEAMALLTRGRLPRRSVVITFDDGWFGCLDGAFAKLADLGWPAMLYVTTYYAAIERPVFNVAVDYLLWKHRTEALDLALLEHGLSGRIALAGPAARSAAAERISAVGDCELGPDERTRLLYRLATALGDDPVELFERRRLCGLLTGAELDQVRRMGIDVQLHTHRHRFPLDDEAAIRREIADNRSALGDTQARLAHLCYPSGVYHAKAYPVLRGLGIRTATTTEPGLNFPSGEPLALSRFLDSDDLEPIEFHGEMAGVGEVMRQFRAGVPPWSARSPLHW